MGIIKQKFRGKAQYFCQNNYLFVELIGENFKDNYSKALLTYEPTLLDRQIVQGF